MKNQTEFETRRKWFTIGIAMSLSAATFAQPMATTMEEPWRADESPELIAPDMNYHMPDPSRPSTRTARVKQIPWTGSYFPSATGSTAIRWRTEVIWSSEKKEWIWPSGLDSNTFKYRFYSAEELSTMTWEEIRENTSSVEKLDILAGNAADPSSPDYYRNAREVRYFSRSVIEENERKFGRSQASELDFHGLCNGFTTASIYLSEPQARKIWVPYTLPDGRTVEIPLAMGSGDFKANATYFYARKTWDYNADVYSGSIGNSGLNAGAFHVLLMTLIGDRGESFGVDTARGNAVWNYPVVGFSTRVSAVRTSDSGPILTKGASKEAVKEVEAWTTVEYMGTGNPTQYPQGARSDEKILRRQYHYRIELTADNRVVGGTWMPGSDQIDFAWKLKGPIPFEGDYAKMEPYWTAHPRE